MTKPINILNISPNKNKYSFLKAELDEKLFREISLVHTIGSIKYLTLIQVPETKWINKNLTQRKKQLIPDKVIRDIHENKTILIILQMFEGLIDKKYATRINDYETIDQWCKNHKFNANQVYYLHENFNQSLVPNNANFTLRSFTTFFCWLQDDPVHESRFIPEDDQYLYLLYNRANRMHRWILGAQLVQRDLLKLGKCSYEILGPDKHTMSKNASTFPALLNLVPAMRDLEKICPLTLEYDSLLINNPVHRINKRHHETTFMSIVTETLCDGELFFSEKIWKPVIAGQPFMLLGSPGLLRMFKSWGFKTFDIWFDESYDDVSNVRNRSEIIVREVERLSKLNITELQAIRNEMMPVLQHNQLRYIELRKRMCSANTNLPKISDNTSDIIYFWNKTKMPAMAICKIWEECIGNSVIDTSDYNNFS
jgi:hypothetical protein